MQNLLYGFKYRKQKLPKELLQFWKAQGDNNPRAALKAAILLRNLSLLLNFFGALVGVQSDDATQ